MRTSAFSSFLSGRGFLSLCSGVLIAILTPVLHAQAWVATGTHALPLINATPLGSVSLSTPIHIAVALTLQNPAGLKALIQNESAPGNATYGTSLSPEQFEAAYSPTASQVQAVESYLASQGFQNIAVEDNSLFVTADGTAQTVQNAFNTVLGQFLLNGQTVYANTADAQVPASLNGIVLSVLGLNNIAAMHSLISQSASVPALKFEYGPQDFQKAYDAGSTPTGSRTSIAVFAEGDLAGVVSDLRIFEKTYGLPEVPVTVIATGIASSDTSGSDEWDLDSQSSTGIAQTVQHLYFYDASSLTDSDLAISFNRFAAQKKALAGNASFGECEVLAYLDGSMLADDEVFAEAAAQGQTVFSSAGDVGAACPVEGTNGVPDSGLPMQSYPAASPYVMAVGGTTLLTNSDGSYDTEIAWYSGGGGISLFEYSMFWQSGIVPSNAAGDKGLPDMAMDADPNTGANIIVGGSAEVVGGTSLSSPLSMGSWARLESAHNNKLGFAAPLLYRFASPANTSTPALPSVIAFHDIVVGSNAGYVATPGWDYTTGLGSFDITQVNKLLP